MIAGDHGDPIRVQTDINLGVYTDFAIEFRHRERGRREFEVTTGVTVGLASLSGGGVTFTPNQYLIYTFQPGDIKEHEHGEWQARGVVNSTSPALRRSGKWQSFFVEE